MKHGKAYGTRAAAAGRRPTSCAASSSWPPPASKVREGVPEGVASHARRAAAIFRDAAQRLGGPGARVFGLRLGDLLAHARTVEATAARPSRATATTA